MNLWLFNFIISLIIFLLLVDWRQLHISIYGGVLSGIYKLAEILFANNLALYKTRGVSLNMPNSIIFLDSINIFGVGIAFLMGIVFLQFLPRKLGLQFIYALIWTLFFMLWHLILREFNLLIFIHFRFYFVTHILVFFLSLAWFKTFYLKRCFNIK